MQIRELVHFSKERCFNGAVQTEWFYDKDRVENVAGSYVFHGPRYFGVSEKDLDLGGHRLIDTASFALNIAQKLGSEHPANSFVMTIAGYGAGKSHLAVSLAALFSADTNLSSIVESNIALADKDIAEKIAAANKKKNLVIVLNGMNNFNLDAEVLKCVRLALAQNGMDDSVLKRLTKSYDIAKRFVEKTFAMCQTQFESSAIKHGINFKGTRLKEFILETIESQNDTLEIVNEVYSEINGDVISWDRGLSAGDILSELTQNLCSHNKPFNKVLVLFDEFGRYIEYAAANPAVAGEAALQQIFEAVQTASGSIVFVGFIQSELDAYLAKIEKTSNIIRYVGRYKASENLFLSSNFETILANLLQKVDEKAFERIVGNALDRYGHFHSNMSSAINRWDRSAVKKGVWTNNQLYNSVILRGCYPLHPITVWLLSNMNSWMQQRSAITFAAEMIDRISADAIQGTWLPYVYPVNIIDSGIYNEMLNSEEKGLVQSQYCMLYRDIMVKIGDKLSPTELSTLKAILIVNIGRFAFSSRDDATTALRYCSNLKDEELSAALKSLENLHGVIAFDENSNTFDLIAEANGFNEFKRVFNRYRSMVKPATIEDCDEAIRKELSLSSDIETSFAQQHHISSLEWRFKKILMNSASITFDYLLARFRELDANTNGEDHRGLLIFAYCNQNAQSEIERLAALGKELQISKSPVIITFLDDSEGEIITALGVKNVLNRFSNADNERFQKHISSQHKSQEKKIIRKFNALVQTRSIITENGLAQYQGRLNNLCSARFDEIYPQALPFMFDGFESKTPTAARRYLSNICIKLFDRTLMNVQSYNALSTDEKNRIKACLSVGVATSWQVFTNSCSFTKPLHPVVSAVFDALENDLESGDVKSILQLIGRYLKAPYGMNVNVLALFTFYYIAYKDKYLLCYFGDEKLAPAHVADKIFKKGKLQQNEFAKIRLQKNVHVNVDLVKELCDEILACTSVEKCQSYKSRLTDLLVQEGSSPDNQILVATASTRLDEGIGLRDSLYEKLRKGQEQLTEAKKSNGIQAMVRILSSFVNTSGTISEGLPFVYSDNFIQQMNTLKKGVDALLKGKALIAIQGFSCNITQLSQFKSVCKNLAISLRNNNYEEYALALERRAIEVEENLLAKQKYEARLVELDRDIAMLVEVSVLGYGECISNLTRLRGWEQFFNQITDMPSKLLDEQKKKISDAIISLTERIEIISKEFSDLVQSLSAASAISQVETIGEKISSSLQNGLNEEDSIVAQDCAREISLATAFIEQLPEAIDELRKVVETVNWSDYGHCKTLVFNQYQQKLNKQENAQKLWCDRYLSLVTSGARNMSAVDCSSWLDKTSELPTYLSSEVITLYKSAKEMVELQLHKCRVQGVFVMYDKLSAEEKAEFKRMIGQ